MRPASKALRATLALAFALMLAGCRTALYQDLDQQEANRMVAALAGAGVPASRERQGDGAFTVSVDEADMARAVDVLEREGLPRPRFASMGEVFAKDGLLSSPTEERARLVWATSQELSATLSQIDGVLSARIHVVLPEERPLGRGGATGGGAGAAADDGGGSASVFLRHKPEADLEALTPQIKMLVTKSIAGLAYDAVTVIRVSAPIGPTADAPAGPALERAVGVWVLGADAARLRLTIGLLLGACLIASLGHAAWFWAWRNGRLAREAAR